MSRDHVVLPLLSRFRGLSIYLYFDDHPPPHFHVRAGSGAAVVEIRTGRIDGDLSARQRSDIESWRREHVLELLMNWDRATRHEPLHSIEPLR